MTLLQSLSWAVSSDPGLRRTSNEDCYATRSDIGLFVVAAVGNPATATAPTSTTVQAQA